MRDCEYMAGAPTHAADAREFVLRVSGQTTVAGVLTDLAMIGVHRRDPDEVTTYVNAALAIARQTGSGVIAHKLRGLQPNLTPLLTDQKVQRLDAEITELVGNRAA